MTKEFVYFLGNIRVVTENGPGIRVLADKKRPVNT